MRRLFTFALLLLFFPSSAFAQKEYGFDNTKPSGQPYFAPEETVRRMKVPPGFEVKLFAAEPLLVNPIAFTLDEKGRAWAIECFEYPKRTPKGKAPRDRIVILEDTNGDGVADKRTVFAEGKDFPVPAERAKAGLGAFDLASGLEVGDGGCYVGAPPYLWHLKDTNADGKADKFEVLASGFGSQDTHEMLNTFTWGPDGWLYGLHGVFTTSKVKLGEQDAIDMDAAVWRYHPRRKKFEIFAEGTSNPWGLDFNSKGDCFICCCVIPHLFHIVPGGIYIKQGDKPSNNPYAYGALRECCDHTFHHESGWAHAGLLCLDQPHMPKEFQSSVIFGSIHGCSLKRNVLERRGSTYLAKRADDFLVSGDKNFRPINLRWGPGGDIYVSDWHDQNPCHQTHPDKWDYERGRIYRIVRKDVSKSQLVNFTDKSDPELVQIATSTDVFASRHALRLLFQRPGKAAIDFISTCKQYASKLPSGVLLALAERNQDEEKLRQFVELSLPDYRALNAPGMTVKQKSERFAQWGEPQLELATIFQVLMAGPRQGLNSQVLYALGAKTDTPELRRRIAELLIYQDPPPADDLQKKPYQWLQVTTELLKHEADLQDPVLPFLYWLVFQRQMEYYGGFSLFQLKNVVADATLIRQYILPRAFRRRGASGSAKDLDECLFLMEGITNAENLRAALAGLAEALKGRRVQPPFSWNDESEKLRTHTDPEIRRLVNAIAVSFGDVRAADEAMILLRDGSKSLEARREAIRLITTFRHAKALPTLLDIVSKEGDLTLRTEAARGLTAFDQTNLASELLRAWPTYPPPLRAELVTTLRSRKPGAKALLEAVAAGQVSRADLNDNTALAIRNFKDKELNALVEKVYGKFRDSPEELEMLMARLRRELPAAAGDPARGHLVFDKHCAQCHRFAGRGHDVGPNLDGAERSPEYLLVNIVDPNRVVGTPYYSRTIVRKSGQLTTGLLVEEDPKTLRLKRENNVIDVIPKDDIDEQSTSTKSLMPEGLSNNLSVQDLRDLIRYLENRK